MKKLIIAMLFTLVFAGSAFAEIVVIDGRVTADIDPAGWRAGLNNNDNMQLSSTALGGGFAVINVNPNEDGLTARQAAENHMERREGRELQPAGEGYIFRATQANGRPAVWYVALDGDFILQIRMMEYNSDMLPVVQTVRVVK